MAKDKLNKVVGNSFEDLKDEEMKKTQGAGDTDAETLDLLKSAIMPPSPLSLDAFLNLTQKIFG